MEKDMKRSVLIPLVLSGLLLLPACSAHQGIITRDETASVKISNQDSDILYFGTRKPNGVVTRAQWDDFLQKEVTARFPDGLTTWEAQGQWEGKSGKTIKEKSYVLLIVHPSDSKSDRLIKEIINIYKQRFDQESVLRVRSKASVSF
jgi:hypothetical protein